MCFEASHHVHDPRLINTSRFSLCHLHSARHSLMETSPQRDFLPRRTVEPEPQTSPSSRRAPTATRNKSTNRSFATYSRSVEPLSVLLPFQPMDSDWPRRIASSPQLIRPGRARSSSASSSASLTATEDNFARRHQRTPVASSSSSRLNTAYPTAWGATTPRHAITGPVEASSGVEDSEDTDDLIYFSRPSSSPNLSTGLRSRKPNGRRREVEHPRMVTTARGQPCAGETETEADEMVSRFSLYAVV